MSDSEIKPSESKTLEESPQPLDRPIDGGTPGEEDRKPREDPNPSEKVAGDGGEAEAARGQAEEGEEDYGRDAERWERDG